MALHRSGLKDYTIVLWYTGEATGGPANAGDLSLIDQHPAVPVRWQEHPQRPVAT